MSCTYFNSIASQLKRTPHALATVRGSHSFPAVCGTVRFYQTGGGVLVAADINGLPPEAVLAFHIHAGAHCRGTEEDPFADAGMHFDRDHHPHPYHAGDLPPLFSNSGHAFFAMLTDRFCVNDILGKTIIVHEHIDDFSTQPAGNAGKKIACGEIRRHISI